MIIDYPYRFSESLVAWLDVNRAGVTRALRRLGHNPVGYGVAGRAHFDDKMRPVRHVLLFVDISPEQLYNSETPSFDRAAGHPPLCIVLDKHPDLCKLPWLKVERVDPGTLQQDDLVLLPIDFASRCGLDYLPVTFHGLDGFRWQCATAAGEILDVDVNVLRNHQDGVLKKVP